jgi:hypothetical protein
VLRVFAPGGSNDASTLARREADVETGVAAPSQGQLQLTWPHHRTYRKDSHAKAHRPAVGHRRQHRRGGGRRAQLRVRGALLREDRPCAQGERDGVHRLGRHDDSRRHTYAQSKDYWQYADEQGEYGEKLNNLTKFVVSSKLDDAPWDDFPAATVTRDPVATIRELKEQSGKDIWLWGSLTLMHSLLAAGVVDEVRMLVCPA